jgi:hypothetical protein
MLARKMKRANSKAGSRAICHVLPGRNRLARGRATGRTRLRHRRECRTQNPMARGKCRRHDSPAACWNAGRFVRSLQTSHRRLADSLLGLSSRRNCQHLSDPTSFGSLSRFLIEIFFGHLLKPFYTPPFACIMSVCEFAKASARRLRHERKKSEKLTKFIRRQSGTFGNRTHRDRVDGIVAGNDEPLFAVGHHDVSALPRDVIAQLFKNTHGVALVYARKFWHN